MWDWRLQVIVAEDKEEFIEKMPQERREQLERVAFEPIVICNPRLKPIGTRGYRYWEGCLSVGGYQAGLAFHQTLLTVSNVSPTDSLHVYFVGNNVLDIWHGTVLHLLGLWEMLGWYRRWGNGIIPLK